MNKEAAVEMLEFSRLTEVVEIFARILYGYFLGLRYRVFFITGPPLKC